MKVPGVLSAQADMNTHTVTVTLDEAKTSVEAVKQALTDAGFPPAAEGTKKVDPPRK